MQLQPQFTDYFRKPNWQLQRKILVLASCGCTVVSDGSKILTLFQNGTREGVNLNPDLRQQTRNAWLDLMLRCQLMRSTYLPNI